MSTNAQSSQGMTIAMSPAGSPQVFSTIPEIRTINGPTGQANEIDVTDLSSTGKEYKLGLKDYGEISCEGFFIVDNAVHALVKDAFDDSIVRLFRITFTDTAPAKIWEFSGYVKGLVLAAGVDAVNTMNLTIRITGAITEYN